MAYGFTECLQLGGSEQTVKGLNFFDPNEQRLHKVLQHGEFALAVGLHKFFDQFGLVHGVAINDQEYFLCHATNESFEEFLNILAFTIPCIVMNRKWPQAFTAEIRLKPNLDPVALTTGVLPAGAQVVPAW